MTSPAEDKHKSTQATPDAGGAQESDAPTDGEGPRAIQRYSYQLFSAFVSLSALIVLAAYYLLDLSEPVRQVLYIIDSIYAIVFLFDFFAQLYIATNKPRYLVTWGWVDLIGSIPTYPFLRLLRIFHTLRTTRRLMAVEPAELRRASRRRLAESTLFAVGALVILVVTLGSIAIATIEPAAPNGNIKTGSDAIWYVMVTVATVGYGDRYPVTNAGRIVGVILMIVGVAAFSVLTSYIASTFLGRRAGVADAERLIR